MINDGIRDGIYNKVTADNTLEDLKTESFL